MPKLEPELVMILAGKAMPEGVMERMLLCIARVEKQFQLAEIALRMRPSAFVLGRVLLV